MLPPRRSALRLPARSRASALGLVVASALTLSACTSTSGTKTTDFTGAKGDVQDVVKRLTDLADDDHVDLICREVLTPAYGAALGRGKGCQDGMERAIDAADFTTLDVTAVTFTGSPALTAQATLTQTVGPKSKDKAKRTITLTRTDEKAKWQIAAISTTAQPATPAESTPASTPRATKN